MDTKIKIAHIKEMLEMWANSEFPEGQDLKIETVYDEEKRRYMLIMHGVDDGMSVFELTASVRVSEQNKIIVEYNGTDKDFTTLLTSKGVALSDIE